MIVKPGRLRDQVVDDDGTSVVMVGTEVLVLSAMATELLSLVTDQPRGLAALAQGLLEAFGDPGPDTSADAVVGALVADLERRGVVRLVTDL